MTVSHSKSAYNDCYDLFDRATDSSIGIRVSCETRGMANNLRTRLHYARKLNREQAKEIFPDDHPDHGKSAYDPLVVRVHHDGDGWWVYIEPRMVQGEVEELRA